MTSAAPRSWAIPASVTPGGDCARQRRSLDMRKHSTSRALRDVRTVEGVSLGEGFETCLDTLPWRGLEAPTKPKAPHISAHAYALMTEQALLPKGLPVSGYDFFGG